MNAVADCYYEYVAEVRTTPTLGRAVFSALAPERSPVQEVAHDELAIRNARIREVLWSAIAAGAEEEAFVSSSALENFSVFLSLLPAAFPASEPYITDKGSICLDWYEDPQNQFSILLQDDNRIAFAAYFAGERVNGSAEFSPEALPRELIELASRWALGQRGRKPSEA